MWLIVTILDVSIAQCRLRRGPVAGFVLGSKCNRHGVSLRVKY
jgi:hypothetical protein